jgi:hypothetical protein
VTLFPSPEAETERVGDEAYTKNIEEEIPKESASMVFRQLLIINKDILYIKIKR